MTTPSETVNVLVDAAPHLGPLSYRSPGQPLAAGTTVRVPFGKKERSGIVIGAGNPTLATRDILEVLGHREDRDQMGLATELACRHLCDLAQISKRLEPADNTTAQLPEPSTGPATAPAPPAGWPGKPACRRLLVLAPLVDQAAVAALEAARLAATTRGQVLVLAPTTEMVKAIHAATANSVRLDARAQPGSWAQFRNGTARVGVGTRAAALYDTDQLAAIIVAAENHPAHREAAQPNTHARDVAVLRADRSDLALTLISDNPSPYALAANVKGSVLGSTADWPRLRLVDRNDYPPEDLWFVPPFRRVIEAAPRREQRVILVGRAGPADWRCQQCGHPTNSEHTPDDTSAAPRADVPPCPRCNTTRASRVGWDAARVAAVFNGSVEHVTLAELPDTAGPATVIIPDIDRLLNSPGDHPEGFAHHVVVNAARAAGSTGLVITSTSQPDHPYLTALFAERQNITSISRRWYREMRDTDGPPHTRTVTVRCTGGRPEVNSWPGAVFGPRRRDGQWEIVVRIPSDNVAALHDPVAKLRYRRKVRVNIA